MNKVVILTGASGAIGKSIAATLKAKYEVVGLTRSTGFDLSRPETIKEAFADLNNVYGLVNNGAIYYGNRTTHYELDDWNYMLQVNLTGAFLCTQACIPRMVDGGRIINITSAGGQMGSRDLGYSASKAGLIGLTKSYARLLANRQILVNAIAPGPILPFMSPECDLKEKLDSTLLKRVGAPNDVSSMVEYLLSNKASFITGATLDVNGGELLR